MYIRIFVADNDRLFEILKTWVMIDFYVLQCLFVRTDKFIVTRQ